MRGTLALFLLCSSTVIGCADSGVDLIIDDDPRATTPLTHLLISIRAASSDGELCWTLRQEEVDELPFRLRVLRGDRFDTALEYEIRGVREEGEERDESAARRGRRAFREGEIESFELVLWSSCFEMTCGDDEDCDRGICEPLEDGFPEFDAPRGDDEVPCLVE